MKNLIRMAALIAMVLFPSTTSWSAIDREYKIQTMSFSYQLLYGGEVEVRLYEGLSAFGWFAYMPKMTINKEIDGQQIHNLSLNRFGLGLRYYITGNPLENGLYVQYSPSISQLSTSLSFRKLHIPAEHHGRMLSNLVSIGYRWNFNDSSIPIFFDLQAGASSNFIVTKDPNSLGSTSTHVWLPSVSTSVGMAF